MQPNQLLRFQFLEKFICGLQAESGPVVLRQNRVYVFASRAGLFFAVVLVLLLIGAINYSLALGYVLTFFLASIGLASLLHTFRNLAYLELNYAPVQPVFAGQPAALPILLRDLRGSAHFAIAVSLRDQIGHGILIDVAPLSQSCAELALPTHRRGYLPAPRLRLYSRFPLGLWRTWSYWSPAIDGLVYPAPETPAPALPPASGMTRDSSELAMLHTAHQGELDLSHLSTYQAGDRLSRIDWKSSAKQDLQNIYIKQLQGAPASELWLSWEATGTLELEARLRRLCAWVLAAHQSGQVYGLRLPDQTIAPNHSLAHYHQCLSALALYGIKKPL